MKHKRDNHETDILLVGAGIMSATLAVMLRELDQSLKIEIHEVLDSPALESSNAWNNAGTGHAALCELNYTPMDDDGRIDISKALEVNTTLAELSLRDNKMGAEGTAALAKVLPETKIVELKCAPPRDA